MGLFSGGKKHLLVMYLGTVLTGYFSVLCCTSTPACIFYIHFHYTSFIVNGFQIKILHS